MNRQSNYPVPDANVVPNSNSYANAQMQQQLPAQKMQQNLGMNDLHGRPDSFSAEQGNSYVSPAQWDRDALTKAQHHDPMLSHPPYLDASIFARLFLLSILINKYFFSFLFPCKS